MVAATVLLFAGLLGVFVIIPAQTTEGELYGLPPSLFPTIGAVLLSLCCGLRIALSFLRGDVGDDRTQEPISARHWRHIASLSAALIVCLVLIQQFGFLIGGPVTIATFMLYMGSRKRLTIAAVALGAPLVIYLFFWRLLSIPLP